MNSDQEIAGGDESGSGKDPQFAYTLARGLEVLQAFSGGEAALGNREIADRIGIPRPTVARLTRTLSMLGYLRYDARSATYRLTPLLLCMAYPVLAQLSVRQVARPLMQQLADHAHGAVSIGVRQGMNIVLVESCVDGRAVTGRPDIGATRPIATTAIGRAYIAAASEAERDEIYALLRAETKQKWKQLKAQLDTANEFFARHGFCIMRDARPGIHGVGVALRAGSNGDLLTMNCAVAAFELRENGLESDIAPRLVQLARNVEMTFGNRT